MTKYVVSDYHFQHENIIRFDGRPFRDKDEMDRVLIENWNRVVGDNDTVYILGDMFYKIDVVRAENILKQLKGKKIYIFGNHEKLLRQDKRLLSKYFVSVHDYLEVPYTYQEKTHKLVMSHYPNPMFNGHFRDTAVHFYGHVHRTKEQTLAVYSQMLNFENSYVANTHKMLNVGVMMSHMGYEPKPVDYLIKQAEVKAKALYDFYTVNGLVSFNEFEKQRSLYL